MIRVGSSYFDPSHIPQLYTQVLEVSSLSSANPLMSADSYFSLLPAFVEARLTLLLLDSFELLLLCALANWLINHLFIQTQNPRSNHGAAR